MSEYYPHISRTHKPCTLHKVPLFKAYIFTSDNTRKTRYEQNTKSKYHIILSRTYYAHDYECDENARKTVKCVIYPHHNLIHQPAIIPCHGTGYRSYASSDCYSRYSNQPCHAYALKNAAENIPSEIIRSHDMRKGRRRKLLCPIHGIGIIGRMYESYEHQNNKQHSDSRT